MFSAPDTMEPVFVASIGRWLLYTAGDLEYCTLTVSLMESKGILYREEVII